MKSKRALACTAISMLFCLLILGQAPLKTGRCSHVQDHIKPGMSQQQIDSLYILAQKAEQNQQLVLKSIIQQSTRNNRDQSYLKSDDCTSQNWGFEQANLNEWTTFGCVELMNGGFDLYSGISNVNQGGYSLKLSNDNDYTCTNSLAARTYSVPSSGQTFITFHFRVNIFNFPHSSDYAAKFNFNLYDINGVELTCPSYSSYYSIEDGAVGIPSLQETNQSAIWYNSNVAGDQFFNSNVSYSDWHHVTVDLSQYAGTDVTMVFKNSWCVFDIDWIYTIIDVDCPVNTALPVPICISDETTDLCAPMGMQATYTWEFEGNTLLNTSPCILISEIGTYELTFSPTYLECTDQDYTLTYELINKPIAMFNVNEFCIGNDPVFTNQSQFATEYVWTYNDENSTNVTPSFNYTPGEFEIQLIAKTGSCSDTIVKNLIPHELPELNIGFDKPCVGQIFKFSNQSFNAEGGSLFMQWAIDDHLVSNEWLPALVATDTQQIHITASVINQFGCTADAGFIISANPKPKADFNLADTLFTENLAVVKFIDQSSDDVYEWFWDFGDGIFSVEQSPNHEYLGFGNKTARLTVFNEFGCSDTADQQLIINPYLDCFVPNTFTPNNDQFNQTFRPVFSGSDINREYYSFTIYNRWGQIVFYSDDVNDSWDGKINNQDCLQGTYTWVINYLRKSDDTISDIHGHVNLIR